MRNGAFQFSWGVADRGYHWIETRSAENREPRRYLTDGQPVGAARIRPYSPLTDFTGLFRILGETAPTEEGVQSFANRFGYLGFGGAESMIDAPEDEHATDFGSLSVSTKPGETRPVWSGESLGPWVREITRMRSAVEIWDVAQAGDVETLSKISSQTDDGGVRFESGSWGYVVRGARLHSLVPGLVPGDLIAPARICVQRQINEHLDGRVSPRLLWNAGKGALQMAIVPNSLIGALWLQFAQAVDGGKDHRRCAVCGTWFEISREAYRKSRKYCSNACRLKAHRQRHAHKEG